MSTAGDVAKAFEHGEHLCGQAAEATTVVIESARETRALAARTCHDSRHDRVLEGLANLLRARSAAGEAGLALAAAREAARQYRVSIGG